MCAKLGIFAALSKFYSHHRNRQSIVTTMIGTTIGNYRIESLVSNKGGMGKVFYARHRHLNTPAAVKAIHAHLTDDPVFRERFRLEAMSLYQLVQHAGIVRFFDYVENETGQFIITEYVEGSNLAQYAQQNGAMPVPQLVRVFSDILDIVSFVHRKGIIHRDLKPANIMLTPQGEVKILDFGIAKVNTDNMTAVGSAIGTIAYLSPERIYPPKDAQGNPLPIDHRSDIYSLGVTLYEALTGGSLYTTANNATSDYEVMMQIVSKPLPRISLPNKAHQTALQAIIDKATHKDREQRYANCELFKNDLQRLLQGQAVQVAPPLPSQQPQPAPARTPPPKQQQRPAPPPPAKGSNDRWLIVLSLLVLVAAFFAIRHALLGDPPQNLLATDKVLTDSTAFADSSKLDASYNQALPPLPLPSFSTTEDGFWQFMNSYYQAISMGDTANILQHFAPKVDNLYDNDQPTTDQLHAWVSNQVQRAAVRTYSIDRTTFSYYILDRKYYGLDYNLTETLQASPSSPPQRYKYRMSATLTPDVRIKSIFAK